MLFLVLKPFTLCPHGPLQLDKVSLDLLRTSLRCGLYHVGGDRYFGFVERHAAQIDGTDFQGALAAVHRRLEELAPYPDLAIALAFLKFMSESILNRIAADMKMLGDHFGSAADHGQLAYHVAVDFRFWPSTSVFRHL